MKIVLLVPDGVAVRNYIYSDFIKELKDANFDIILYHQVPDSAINAINEVKKNEISEIVRIPDFKVNFFSRILQESIVYARLLLNSQKLENKSILLFWNRNQKGCKNDSRNNSKSGEKYLRAAV